ncbi:hypothetical protein CEXT_128681 [Caerostris extrusa]|uniref:Uncharacterized protein n=1 Tax=Caerostris extrusa TaxID=172846 RepID=A0AAV4V614_CAEEX|nr:hypothetical protein CEXT_128681 [Caerostris extrusa]
MNEQTNHQSFCNYEKVLERGGSGIEGTYTEGASGRRRYPQPEECSTEAEKRKPVYLIELKGILKNRIATKKEIPPMKENSGINIKKSSKKRCQLRYSWLKAICYDSILLNLSGGGSHQNRMLLFSKKWGDSKQTNPLAIERHWSQRAGGETAQLVLKKRKDIY